MCTCSDIPALEQRLKRVQTAIGQYEARIAEQQAADAGGKPTGFTGDAKEAAVDKIEKQSGLRAKSSSDSGDTNGVTCEIQVRAPNRCVWGSLQTHENLHAQICTKFHEDARAAGKTSTFGTDYREAMSLVDFYNEEIRGYQAEIQYIDKNLAKARADKTCKWKCIDDDKTYEDHSQCERACRGGLKVIRKGFRCDPVANQ